MRGREGDFPVDFPVTGITGERGRCPRVLLKLAKAVAAIDVATRLSVVRQDTDRAMGLMFAQNER